MANNVNLGLNDSFLKTIADLDQSCGYAAFREQYMTFPASGVQPTDFFNYTGNASCDVFTMANNAALGPNPCFNIYETNQQCPLLWDVLAFPTELVYLYPGAEVYFNRTDVKTAMHAPLDVNWMTCAVRNVFVGDPVGPEDEGDYSADPIQKVLPQVIEATNRVLISNADLDMVIITNGTLLAIQNMTWNGQLGFQNAPQDKIITTLPDLQYEAVFNDSSNGVYYAGLDVVQGTMGVQHYERGLMWAQTFLAGHMQPQFQPRVSYRHIQWLLGHIDTL